MEVLEKTTKMQYVVLISVIALWRSASSAAGDVGPFSPPFLRIAGQSQSHPSFNYLQPQAQPQLVHPHSHYVGNPLVVQPTNIGPSMLKSEPGIVVQEGNRLQDLGFNNPSEVETFPQAGGNDRLPIANSANFISHHQDVPNSLDDRIGAAHVDAPISASADGYGYLPGGHEENELHEPNQLGEELPKPLGTGPDNRGTKTGRPQLRHLVVDPAALSRDAEARRDKLNGNMAATRRGRSSPRVSEGHRLITRALWRIFDALMEKNEKQELHGRMNFVENALKDMITSDSKLEGMMEMIKEENLGQDERLDQLTGAVDALRSLASEVEELKRWRLGFERQQDEEESLPPWGHQPAYTSCPSPFETVAGECFYVAGETKRTWQDARRDCSKYGGDLAAPSNIESLRTYLQSLAYQPEYVWVGASRQGNGDWVWTAGPGGNKAVPVAPETWNVDLPSGLGNCMGLYEGAAYRAYDYHCSEVDLYVCQFFL